MLDGIPFGGPGRVVRKSNAQAQAIAQLTLNLLLPGATLRAIATAGVGEDEDVAGLRVAPAAFLQPPFAETGDGEGGCFVGSSQENRAAVGLSVVDADPGALRMLLLIP
jgi:hypothetical protein